MHVFTILSDPVRRRILEHLGQRDLTSGEIVTSVGGEFCISQSAISQHLRVLRENRFANVRVDGARRIYSLEPQGLAEADQWLAPFRRFWEPKLMALAKEIERGKKKKER